jgi:hypothetical protein
MTPFTLHWASASTGSRTSRPTPAHPEKLSLSAYASWKMPGSSSAISTQSTHPATSTSSPPPAGTWNSSFALYDNGASAMSPRRTECPESPNALGVTWPKGRIGDPVPPTDERGAVRRKQCPLSPAAPWRPAHKRAYCTPAPGRESAGPTPRPRRFKSPTSASTVNRIKPPGISSSQLTGGL